MNKTTAIKVISIILALVAIFTAYGCKDKDSQSEKVYPTELHQPVVEDGTAVIEYPTVDENGEEVQVTKSLKVENKLINSISTGTTLDKELDDEESKKEFVEEYKDNYDLDDKKAEEIVNNAAKWINFRYDIFVANSNSKPIAFRYLKAQSTDSIRINTELECEYGIPSGTGMTISIEGIYNAAEYEDTEILKEALKEMNIQVPYATLEAVGGDVDDWDTVPTKLMKLEIN